MRNEIINQQPFSRHVLGELCIRYWRDPGSDVVGWEIVPVDMEADMAPRNFTRRPLESLVQIKRVGDPYSGAFAQGHTLRNGPSSAAFHYDGQAVMREGDTVFITTRLRSAEGHRIEHRVEWRTGDPALRVCTAFFNDAAAPVQLELLSSFSLAGLSPFDEGDGTGRLRVHRFRSVWAAEGRHDVCTPEQLHLEPSGSHAGAFSERFGQVGTMPVRKWFPFIALEDTAAGVLWGAQLAWPGSWQMEIYRKYDDMALSGGLADREFGHWMKTVRPGESFVTPVAIVACARGDLDDLCDRLTGMQQRAADAHPAIEQDLPVIFNEWCTSWGDPSHERLVSLADRLKDSESRVLVIDAGWYKTDGTDWGDAHGDWIPNPRLFPEGLESAAHAIRARGLVPGLWFEMETVGTTSTAFSLADHLLQRDGRPVTVRERRFWNFADPWVVDYLTERVIGLLERGGFGYLKIDYNETLGLGCEHPDSLGEGLRVQVEASIRFIQEIRRRLPDLVIENCASGGHRLEPLMMGLTAMSSFSDAHELAEIPIIAANLHRLMLPRQSQIWAVLRRGDSARRLAYSLAASFLGRMCLSGDADALSPAQWAVVKAGQAFYAQAAPVIKHGFSRGGGERGESWRHPTGWQFVRRVSTDGKRLLLVAHAFANPPRHAAVTLPPGVWRCVHAFPGDAPAPVSGELALQWAEEFSAQAFLFEKDA